MVKSRVIDVMTRENQACLATRLAAFHPTNVLVECSACDQSRLDEKFAAYKKGKPTVSSNEVCQIGFRVSKCSGLKRVTCFDEDKIGWDAEPMFNYINANDTKMQASLDAVCKSLWEQANHEYPTSSRDLA